MNPDKLERLQIDPGSKRRPRRSFWGILLAVAIITAIALYFGRPWAREEQRLMAGAAAVAAPPAPASADATHSAADNAGDIALTASGYIINRERIEISPRFLGLVTWIGVSKGDSVTNGQVIVKLDDSEYQARLREARGRLENARAAANRAELTYNRIHQLARTDIESQQAEDEARLQFAAARAAVEEAEGTVQLAQTYVDWCTIRSPINGVVLEKLVNPDELVMPQSFGGPRGPSTALIAVADPKDLQVEVDVNESDLARIFKGQKCIVSPEAYPDHHFDGYVAEVAPEADRAKGTLQIKVQIVDPDRYLTPELSARVDFLKSKAGADR